MREHKYNAKSITIGDKVFRSQLEGRIYKYLIERNIPVIEYERKFTLIPPFVFHGEKVRKMEYKPDFVIEYAWKEIVLEVKGRETPDWKIKDKLFKYQNPDVYYLVTKSIKSLQEQLKHFD